MHKTLISQLCTSKQSLSKKASCTFPVLLASCYYDRFSFIQLSKFFDKKLDQKRMRAGFFEDARNSSVTTNSVGNMRFIFMKSES